MFNQHKTIEENIKRFNKPLPLAEYLIPLVGDKKEVKILDIGSGPYSVIGNYLDGVKVDLRLCDNQHFISFYEKYKVTPFQTIEYQDMERLTYKDGVFDIVHCANALDHTRNALVAVKEMIRVCKYGGWIYIDCWLDQLSTGGKHYWNVKENGMFICETGEFDLKDFGFNIKFIDKGGERRYNQIIATLQK